MQAASPRRAAMASPTSPRAFTVRSSTPLSNSPTLKVLCEKRFVSQYVSKMEKSTGGDQENVLNNSPLRKRPAPDSPMKYSASKRQRVAMVELDSPAAVTPPPPYPSTPPPPLVLSLSPLSARKRKKKEETPERKEGRRVRRKRNIEALSPRSKQSTRSKKKQQQLREAYMELLESTKNYQDMLDRHPHFQDMLHANGVKDANIALLFPNSQELSRLNSELLKELHHAIEPVQMNPEIVDSAMPAAIVSQLFIKFASEASLPYAEWMSHVNSTKVKDLQTSLARELPHLFEEHSLDSILITPVQRICKFQLLLLAIYKHTAVPEQRSLIRLAREFMEQLCNKLDEGLVAQKKRESNALLQSSTSFKELEQSADFGTRNFIQLVQDEEDFCPSISYTVEGNPVAGMSVRSSSTRYFQVHVFDQYVLLAVQKQKHWVARHLLELSFVFVEAFDSQDSRGGSNFGLLLMCPGLNGEDIGVRYHFHLPSRQERDCMQQALQNAIDEFTAIHSERANERSQHSITWTKDGPYVAREVVFTTNQCPSEAFAMNATTNEEVEDLMNSEEFRQWQEKQDSRSLLTPQKRLRNWGMTIHGSAKKLISKDLLSRTPRKRSVQSISYETDSDGDE